MDDSHVRPARRDDWQRKPLPEQHVVLSVDRVYTPEEMRLIRRGLIPEEMEDKWFIFCEDDVLYCHRSWTGVCIYQAEFEREAGHYRVSRLLVNRDPDQYKQTDDGYDARQFVFLVDLLLLGHFPQPPEYEDDLDEGHRALRLWSIFGRGLFRGDDRKG
jgi:hypothetical protein